MLKDRERDPVINSWNIRHFVRSGVKDLFVDISRMAAFSTTGSMSAS